jgi:uncharacterized coiled-coil protein SlyX
MTLDERLSAIEQKLAQLELALGEVTKAHEQMDRDVRAVAADMGSLTKSVGEAAALLRGMAKPGKHHGRPA